MQESQRTDSPPMTTAVPTSEEGTGVRSRWEWPIVLGLLLIAFFFRVWQLNDVPPGLHHDEVIIGQVAKEILRGHFGIYFTAGYGHEPLYHYAVAGMFGAIGANVFVLRLTSAFIAMLGLATTYVLVRRILSPAAAIGTLAWMSISFWPVFFARVGLRGITLPLLTTLTAYFLWRALFGDGAKKGWWDGEKVVFAHYAIRSTLHPAGNSAGANPLHLSGQPRLPTYFWRVPAFYLYVQHWRDVPHPVRQPPRGTQYAYAIRSPSFFRLSSSPRRSSSISPSSIPRPKRV